MWVSLFFWNSLNESSGLKILSETGSDISSWPTEKHFCSWLGLSPGNKVTSGKILSGKTKPSANRAAAAFRLAAFGLLNSKSALGVYCRVSEPDWAPLTRKTEP